MKREPVPLCGVSCPGEKFGWCCNLFLLFLLLASGARAQAGHPVCGADQPDQYLTSLKGLRIGLVVNATSMVGGEHLVDFLAGNGIVPKRLFAPEHGLRGDADAGEQINNSVDAKTGIPIVSIYGKSRKPTTAQLKDIDLVLFDIQDVGCRFYTYVSTLHYVMEACAENNKELMILDRPNPNGDYCEGPVLKKAFRSFVGVDPIPVVHGCTMGEMARMINGEGWLQNGAKCRLKVVPVRNYTHQTRYLPPVKPSPNLPDLSAIRLYPSLCLFEATSASIGRGTTFPFQVIGYPDRNFGEFSFTPRSLKGFEMDPIQKDKTCYGEDLRKLNEIPHFTLRYFLAWYKKFDHAGDFLTKENWFNLLMGDDRILKFIQAGKSEAEITASWQEELNRYKVIRSKYLLYRSD